MASLSLRAKALSLSKEKKKKLKELEKALEASDSSLIERILGRITLPTPEKGKDGRDAPELSDILEAVTPLLPETKIEQTVIQEKIDKGDLEGMMDAMLTAKLPEIRPEDRPAVEQITNTIDVSDEKLEGFVSQEEMKQHLIKIQRAITASQSGGSGTPDVGPIVNLIEADQATNVVLVTDLDTSKINIVHATVASSTVQLPAISSNYIVWVEDAVTGGGNITITREA